MEGGAAVLGTSKGHSGVEGEGSPNVTTLSSPRGLLAAVVVVHRTQHNTNTKQHKCSCLACGALPRDVLSVRWKRRRRLLACLLRPLALLCCCPTQQVAEYRSANTSIHRPRRAPTYSYSCTDTHIHTSAHTEVQDGTGQEIKQRGVSLIPIPFDCALVIPSIPQLSGVFYYGRRAVKRLGSVLIDCSCSFLCGVRAARRWLWPQPRPSSFPAQAALNALACLFLTALLLFGT